MIVAVVGSRTMTDAAWLAHVLNQCRSVWGAFTVISGGARGADALALAWARERDQPFRLYAARWGKYGKRAGPLRNRRMVEDAQVVVAFWDGQSAGTASTIAIAKELNRPVYVYPLERAYALPGGKP